MIITAETLTNISDALARVLRRFDKHKTLLLFHEGSPLPPKISGEDSGEMDNPDYFPPEKTCFPQVSWSWESEMLKNDGILPGLEDGDAKSDGLNP